MTTNNKGNKKLTKKIGLLTMDEGFFAGLMQDIVQGNYLENNSNTYFSVSPYNRGNSGDVSAVYGVGNGFNWSRVDYEYGVKPVINLKAEALDNATGIGTYNNPFVVN